MAQLENGYTRIANELLEAFICHRIPGEQMQCLLFILRKTYGHHKKADFISLSQFVEATGIVKQHICRALKELNNKNIIITKKGNDKNISYSINKIYNTWKSLPKKVTLPKMVISVTKKGNRKKSNIKESIGNNISTKKIITKDIKEIYKEKFEIFRKIYPGTKRGIDTEFDNFKKKHKDYKEYVELLLPAIKKQIQIHDKKIDLKLFCPEYKMLQTWINQKCWEEEEMEPEENNQQQTIPEY